MGLVLSGAVPEEILVFPESPVRFKRVGTLLADAVGVHSAVERLDRAQQVDVAEGYQRAGGVHDVEGAALRQRGVRVPDRLDESLRLGGEAARDEAGNYPILKELLRDAT